MITTDYMAIARGLQHSNVKEVAELAQGYLKLAERFDDLMNRHVRAMGEIVLTKHERLFKKLAEHESKESEGGD